jgi:hypothetical protein
MYYTTRELSNRAAEMDVLRSLGREILKDGDTSQSGGIPSIPGGAGGVSWLQEHFRTNYTPGWTTLVRDNKTDAAVGDIGASRWGNYYVEGMKNLACETGVDGAHGRTHKRAYCLGFRLSSNPRNDGMPCLPTLSNLCVCAMQGLTLMG